MTRALSALALVLVLIGCAGKPTPYQPKTDRTGYSQQKLDAQTWRVQFIGNINTPRETVENYLLYRSAEIMLFGGYEKFVMLEKDIERNVEYRVLRKGFETIDCGFHAANASGCCCSALTCAGVI